MSSFGKLGTCYKAEVHLKFLHFLLRKMELKFVIITIKGEGNLFVKVFGIKGAKRWFLVVLFVPFGVVDLIRNVIWLNFYPMKVFIFFKVWLFNQGRSLLTEYEGLI